MKKTPYRAVLKFSPICDVLRAAFTYSAVLGLRGKGKCDHIGGVLFAIEDFIGRRFQNNPKPLTSTSLLSVWVIPRNQRVVAKPIDKILIRKIPVFNNNQGGKQIQNLQQYKRFGIRFFFFNRNTMRLWPYLEDEEPSGIPLLPSNISHLFSFI